MNLPVGTPKTLDEALTAILYFGALKEIEKRAHVILRDYLAQVFGIAMLKVAGKIEIERALQELFEQIVGRDE